MGGSKRLRIFCKAVLNFYIFIYLIFKDYDKKRKILFLQLFT